MRTLPRLVSRPASLEEAKDGGRGAGERDGGREGGLEEVGSVKEFGSLMERKGVLGWWRKGMGYVH